MTKSNSTPRNGLPLAAKFGLGTGVTMLFILALLITFQVAYERGKIQQAISEKGNEVARLLAVAAVQPILNYDFITLEALVKEASSDKLVAFAQCTNGDGKTVAESGGGAAPGIETFVAQIPGNNGTDLGKVTVGIDTAPYRAELITNITWIAGAIILSGVALVVMLLLLLDRVVLRPLRRLTKVLGDMAEGNLAIHIDASGSDEVSHLLRTSDTMAKKLRDHVEEVATATGRLEESAVAMRQFADDTNARVHHQERDTDHVARAMQEMAATVQAVAKSAAETAAAAQRANDEARAGQETVGKTIDRIRLLASEMDETTGVIRNLREKSETIGSVLDVIRAIAEQTNLLALNAAIEAARAGDQGRGFAVVADEVRTLANRTQQSAQEIQTMIESLQEGTKQAVSVMDQGRAQAQQGAEDAGSAGAALTTITQRIVGMSDMTAQIASAAEEQSAVADDVNRNVENIRRIAHETTTGAEKIAKTADLLSGLVHHLDTTVKSFRL